MKHLGKLAVLGAVLAASAQFASAQISITSGNWSTDIGSLVATNVATGSLVDTPASPSFTATYTESVYEGGGPDAACPTCLNFVYTLQNTGNNFIDQISQSNYGSFTATVGYEAGTGVEGITSDSLTAGTLTLAIGNLTAGETLDTFVVFTNATNYAPGGLISFQDGYIAGGSDDIASSATPEPSSLLLLGTGLIGTAGILVRKRQTA